MSEILIFGGTTEGRLLAEFCAAKGIRAAVSTATEYGAELTAAVARGNVMGCQFHPEKSGDVGLAILKTFCEGSW